MTTTFPLWCIEIVRRVLPGACVLCGVTVDARAICSPCVASLPSLGHACARCAMPVDHVDDVCEACAATPPPFEGALGAVHFAPPVTRLVHLAKFHRSLVAARALGEVLADRIVDVAEPIPDLLVPVPLHARRLRERGFNQAQEIARPVARRSGAPIVARAVARVVATDPQSAMASRGARERNLRGAFIARPTAVAGARVAVVDDVLTSGATARAVTIALLAAHARSVRIWAVARARR